MASVTPSSTPVRLSPAESTYIEAIVTVAELDKPDNEVGTSITPEKNNAGGIRIDVISIGTHRVMYNTIATTMINIRTAVSI